MKFADENEHLPFPGPWLHRGISPLKLKAKRLQAITFKLTIVILSQ